MEGFPDLGLGQTRELGDLACITPFVERGQRFEHAGLGQLDLAEHVRCTMLERLKRADGHTELLTLLQVGDRALKALQRAPQHP